MNRPALEMFYAAVNISLALVLFYCTGCPTRYRTRRFFNNFTTNENIATKFEADLPHCVRNVKERNVILFKFRCNIFIGVRTIIEIPGSVASGTPCMFVSGVVRLIITTYHTEEVVFVYDLFYHRQ
jgi:hypothetical protein